ncbi:hypothetical protein ZWY2020_055133 [Hordeum vulgare]|nr:hypothetical protein ZWY2020_055133 [Hordeum vulgare]
MEQSWIVPCDSVWSMEEAAGWSSDSNQVFKEAVAEVHAYYLQIMQVKMHKFPPSLVDVDQRYKVPLTVAIGPYHHGHPGMMEAEQMKNVAADQCVRYSSGTLQDMYNAVSLVSPCAHKLYYPDGLAKFPNGILPMMFLDACFLVQFIRWYQAEEEDMDPALSTYFYANFERISTDIMMLENQIPWIMVKIIFSFMRPVLSSPWSCPWEKFVVAMRRGLKNQMVGDDVQDLDIDPMYEPPHLLGLVRFYIVGKYKDDKSDELPPEEHPPEEHPPEEKPMSLSISVAELEDIGIRLVPKTGTEAVLADMRLHSSKWGCFSDLFVPPLCLTEANATSLVNMAALELCIAPDFNDVGAENSAVCSYLHLFAMLLDQERHVQDLRKNKVIEGGGLTSKETLQFFTSIGKNMRHGTSYLHIIIEIDEFKRKRSFLLKAYLFIMKHWTKIIAVTTVIGAVAGILSSLQNLKTKQPRT